MDIKIRGLDPKIVTQLDQMAKAENVSREQFLRDIITQIVENNFISLQEEKYIQLNEKSLKIIEDNSRIIKTLIELIEV